MSFIDIQGMHFYAHHGCFEEERAIGTNFDVDVRLSVDTEKAQRSDCLNDTVNYAEVYLCVSSEMGKPSHLLENVAERIGNAILEGFPSVDSVQVSVAKLNPPLGGHIGEVRVAIEKSRTV